MPATADELVVVPANQASWDDLQAVLGPRGYPTRCQCQRYKLLDGGHWRMPVEEKVHRLREQTDCGNPDDRRTSGLVAYRDTEPVGWCAVEPRPEYARLLGMPVPWKGRDEDRTDERIWAITCFVVRSGHRRRGYTYALAAAAVEHARAHGARAIEGYPMITHPGVEITWDELHVGSRTVFAAAGFTEVSHPTKRRVVMRLELG